MLSLILCNFSSFFATNISFLLAQATDTEMTTTVQNKARQNVAVHVAIYSRHVLNLYSRHDETVNEIHSSIEMVGYELSLSFYDIFG